MKRPGSIGIIAFVAATVAVRLWFAGVLADSPLGGVRGEHDRALYHDAARAVAGGQVWPVDSFDYLPLYPWVLGAGYALFGERPSVPMALGILCEAVTVLLILLLARRLGAHPAIAAVAAGLYAVYPPAVVYSTLTMPNTLNAMLVTALAYALHRMNTRHAGWCFGVGLLGGITALGFAGSLLILAVCLAWLVLRRDIPWKGAALCILACALPILPVALHNSRAEGQFVMLSTHGGFNLYMGNHERATGYPVRVRDFNLTARLMLQDAHRAAEEATGRSLGKAESSAWWRDQARAFWRQHPARAIGLTIKKAALFWNHRDVDDLRLLEQLRLTDGVFLSRFWPGFLWFGLLGLIGLLFARNAAMPKAVLLAGMASLVMFFITARYRLTFIPVMAALGAAGLSSPWIIWKLRWRRALWLIPAAVLVVYPFPGRDLRPFDHYNASVQVLAAGRSAEALDLARRGLRIDPISAELYHAEGSALYAMDRFDEAAQAFQRTVALRPAYPNAQYNLALSLARSGRVCDAADALAPWVEHMPADTRSAELMDELRRLCAETE